MAGSGVGVDCTEAEPAALETEELPKVVISVSKEPLGAARVTNPPHNATGTASAWLGISAAVADALASKATLKNLDIYHLRDPLSER